MFDSVILCTWVIDGLEITGEPVAIAFAMQAMFLTPPSSARVAEASGVKPSI